MPPPDSVRAYIHECFFLLGPAIPDQNLEIVSQALDAAVNDIWDWMSNNQLSLNNGLPNPFRTRPPAGRNPRLEDQYSRSKLAGEYPVNNYIALIRADSAGDTSPVLWRGWRWDD